MSPPTCVDYHFMEESWVAHTDFWRHLPFLLSPIKYKNLSLSIVKLHLQWRPSCWGLHLTLSCSLEGVSGRKQEQLQGSLPLFYFFQESHTVLHWLLANFCKQNFPYIFFSFSVVFWENMSSFRQNLWLEAKVLL